jgi:hypothetical protein
VVVTRSGRSSIVISVPVASVIVTGNEQSVSDWTVAAAGVAASEVTTTSPTRSAKSRRITCSGEE